MSRVQYATAASMAVMSVVLILGCLGQTIDSLRFPAGIGVGIYIGAFVFWLLDPESQL